MWTLWAERIKANRRHRVPLSSRAEAVVEETAKLWDGGGLIFPGTQPGRPLSENMHAKPLKELGFEAVTHGFRSSFRDYAAERTHTPHAVMEATPAHAVRNKVDDTAKQAAHETVFGRKTDRECGDDHVIRASGAMERVHLVGETMKLTI